MGVLLVKASSKMSTKVVVPAVRKVETKATVMLEGKVNKAKKGKANNAKEGQAGEPKAGGSGESSASASASSSSSPPAPPTSNSTPKPAKGSSREPRSKAMTMDAVISLDDVTQDKSAPSPAGAPPGVPRSLSSVDVAKHDKNKDQGSPPTSLDRKKKKKKKPHKRPSSTENRLRAGQRIPHDLDGEDDLAIGPGIITEQEVDSHSHTPPVP